MIRIGTGAGPALELCASGPRARATLELPTRAGLVRVSIDAPSAALGYVASSLAGKLGGMTITTDRDLEGEAIALLTAVEEGDPVALDLLLNADPDLGATIDDLLANGIAL